MLWLRMLELRVIVSSLYTVIMVIVIGIDGQ